MRKVFLTYCDYPKEYSVYILYAKYTKPRFIEYCNLHGFEFVEIDTNLAFPTHNFGFSKIFWIKQNMHTFTDGDIITYMDIDCCIMDGRVPAVFDADFSIVRETCGLLCMGGTWSVRISDWSRRFIDDLCSLERQGKNKDNPFWNTWHENGAIYHVLGLPWEAPEECIGDNPTTIFTKEELLKHVMVLPANWGVTYNPGDVNFSIPVTRIKGVKRNPNRTYQIISQCALPERIIATDDIIVRHLSARTFRLNWASKYLNTKMKV